MADEEPQTTKMEESAPPSSRDQETNGGEAGGGEGEVVGSAAMRPVFLGNLKTDYSASEVSALFSRPIVPPGTPEGTYTPIPVDRCDLKRGYCFVFLKDAASQADKERAEKFVSAINGM
jgi:RNA recognition motif-containing protein